MTLRRHLLNGWLRRIEKPRLARTGTPDGLRRSFERTARLLFHAPRGTGQTWRHISLGADRALDMLEITPREIRSPAVILYFHGGGFVMGSPATHAAMLGQIARRTGCRVVMPRYRLAPEHPFPAAVDDARSAWDHLLAEGVAPARIILGGDSAGGALAFSLLGLVLAEGAASPGAVFGFSPLTDMTYGSASFRQNETVDAMLPATRAAEVNQLYLAGQPTEDPRASPIRADFSGAPPVWLTVGDTEILRDDARGMARVLADSGADVTLIERHDLPHVWPILHNFLPEARETLDSLAAWIRRQPAWTSGS